MTINDRIKSVRFSTGLGQTAFSKTLSISQSSYDRYERNGSGIPNEVVISIIRVYGIHTDWLMFGDGGEDIRYKREFIEKDKYKVMERKLTEMQELLIKYQNQKIENLETDKKITKSGE